MNIKHKSPEIHKVEKPQSTISTLLNGVGNGMMVGGGIPFGIELVTTTFKPDLAKNLPKNFTKFAIVSSAVGAVVGAVYSFREAHHITEYRAALATDIENLHAQVDGLTKQAAPVR